MGIIPTGKAELYEPVFSHLPSFTQTHLSFITISQRSWQFLPPPLVLPYLVQDVILAGSDLYLPWEGPKLVMHVLGHLP